ncbi:MAG: NAD-dependent epimerase/dehydratase family protein [Thermoplasmata archaeon]
MPMKVAVFGGSGFVGRHLIPILLEEYDVAYISRNENGRLKEIGVHWIKGDIRYSDTIPDLSNFDIIIDLVAVINQKEQRHVDVNVNGVKNILSKMNKKQKIVYFSALNADIGQTEYFRTKREAEKIITERGNYLIFRPGIIFGEDDYLTLMLKKLNTPFIPKSGYLCPVYVESLSNLVEKMLLNNGIVEVSGPEKIKLVDMYKTVRGKKAMEIPHFLLYPFLPFLPISNEQLKMLKLDFCRPQDIWTVYGIEPVKYKEFFINK